MITLKFSFTDFMKVIEKYMKGREDQPDYNWDKYIISTFVRQTQLGDVQKWMNYDQWLQEQNQGLKEYIGDMQSQLEDQQYLRYQYQQELDKLKQDINMLLYRMEIDDTFSFLDQIKQLTSYDNLSVYVKDSIYKQIKGNKT